MAERLQKLLAAVGLCSRRMAEEWISAGRVCVNGAPATLGDRADPETDTITVDGQPLPADTRRVYLMLNKPRGYVTTLSDEYGRHTAAELVSGCGARVYPVGRLDRDSEGLLLFTNDGDFAHRLLHPSHQVDKVYLVTVRGDIRGAAERLMAITELDGELGPVAEFYGWQEEQMGVSYRCRLSASMAALNRGSVVTGMVDKDTPAVFITGVDITSMAVTDILIYRQEAGLVNVALDKNSGVSAAVYPYRQLSPQDIDGDGIIELPCPDADSAAEQTDGFVAWMSWKSDGRFEQSVKTYHCLSAGWYFTIPLSWWNWDVDALVTAISNENQMTLCINGGSVLSVYTITGENRDSRSRMGHRLVLRRQTTTVYAGEVFEIAPYYGMDEDLLRRSFNLILGTWNNS